MKREEKIKKIAPIISQALGMPIEEVAEEVLDALEEPEPQKFREHEIVWYSGLGETYREYCNLDDIQKGRAKKLTTEQFAHTIAPPDAVRWRLCNNVIEYMDKRYDLCREKNGYVYRTYCPHDGEAEGTL